MTASTRRAVIRLRNSLGARIAALALVVAATWLALESLDRLLTWVMR